MQIEERREGTTSILDLSPPREGTFSKELFLPHIEHILEEGQKRIVVNLERVRWLNSTAMGLLMSAFRTARTADVEMVFAGANARIAEIMRVTGMLQLWKSYPDVESAMAGLESEAEG